MFTSTSLAENSGKHLHYIIESTTCERHKTPEGFPCFAIPRDGTDDSFYPAVCGSRIKEAGFVGSVSAHSLRLKTPGGRGHGRY